MSDRMRARVIARRGLRRGCRSQAFTLSELAEAEIGNNNENVYVELDGSGQLTARGGTARAARVARIAPAPPAATVLLCVERTVAPSGDTLLRLRLAADAAPLQELLIWFDEHTLALLDMPFLTLRNITGKKNYACHECGAEFEHPNPLKIHMFLSCRPYHLTTFWTRCVDKLRPTTTATTLASSPVVVPPFGVLVPQPVVADPAQLEALAASWGRSRDGHVCLYCGKLYSRKYGLKIHIRTHTGYKPLRCRHCLRAFGDPSNLNKHVRLHAASEAGSIGAGIAHACTLCRKPLARRRDLLRHLRTHHPHALSTAGHT